MRESSWYGIATTAAPNLAALLVSSRLERLAAGSLEIVEGGRRRVHGRPGGLQARLEVHHPDFWTRVLLGGSVGGAEAYMDGLWSSPDLTALIRLFARDKEALGSLEAGASRIGLSGARLQHLLRKNTVAGGRRNISEHYDLGTEFFSWMLDPTMTYSSAIYSGAEDTLEQASVRKLDTLCRLLELGPEDHLLEIGTGWGSMAVHAAKHYGCQVTTTTISKDQWGYARARVEREGLAGRVEVLDRDYRQLDGRYSKLVSVEMIEAVGAEYLPTYFAKLGRLVPPGGLVAIQSITMTDQLYQAATRDADFIKRYIFPGSNIPSPTALLAAATGASELCLKRFTDYTPHYARTLKEWRERLEPHRAQVVQRYGERFWRMWMYYLAYCEAGFLESYTGVAQLLFQRMR